MFVPLKMTKRKNCFSLNLLAITGSHCCWGSSKHFSFLGVVVFPRIKDETVICKLWNPQYDTHTNYLTWEERSETPDRWCPTRHRLKVWHVIQKQNVFSTSPSNITGVSITRWWNPRKHLRSQCKTTGKEVKNFEHIFFGYNSYIKCTLTNQLF